MPNLTTAILGAGAVLGLDFGDLLKPTTSNITHVKMIIENPSFFICGYSFGDLYMNQLLRRKLVHGRNQKIIIVDR